MSEPASEHSPDPVLARIAPRWAASRTERNLAGTLTRIARRRQLRRASFATLAAAGAAVAVLGGVRLAAQRPSPPVVAQVSRPADARLIRFGDGSTVSLLDPRARAQLIATTRDEVQVQLIGGTAEVEVMPAGSRVFVFRFARVSVKILAARFTLTPEADRVRIAVAHGQVQVDWPGGRGLVGTGEDAWFPPAPAPAPAPATAAAAAQAQSHRPRNTDDRHALARLRSRFRAQAARREYAAAYQSLVAAPGVAEHSPEDLLLAADAARLSGHAAESVPYFQRLLRDHADDVRAPVAAFTLGRILLSQLDRPAEAAEAFALVRRLAPSGTLAPDALAREVEAAARAGDRARARRLAEEYLARHPPGRRAASVRRFGGLE